MNTKSAILLLFTLLFSSLVSAVTVRDSVYIRVNQVGYLESDSKVAVAFSNSPVSGRFSVHNAENGKRVFRGSVKASEAGAWESFKHYYYLDFSEVEKAGRYYLQLPSGVRSAEFGIGRSDS